MLPRLTDQFCDRLRDSLHGAGYTADGVVAVLGDQAHAALGRGEPEPARRATRGDSPRETLVRMFLVGDTVPRDRAARALGDLDEAAAEGLVHVDGDDVRAALDLRPYGDDEGSWWVLADLDAEQLGRPVGPDHVLGIGHASLSLARATVRRKVGSVLDLGTGCGIQALHASRHADRVTATDLSERALKLAEATFRLNDLRVETARGTWFEPVAGRRFDQVVCNPPFVVGPPRVDYVYRDSGLAGDDASALVVRGLPGVLAEGGVGQLLASWLHKRGEDWSERVASWLPDEGIDAWFVQRDIAEPALYVGTWLRDTGVDPRSAEGSAKASAWLDWFDANDVVGIGFGFVTLRATDSDTEVACEDLRHAFDDPLGQETGAWLDRVAWLRANADPKVLLSTRLIVPPTVVLERVAEPGEVGWSELVRRLHRTDGPGWQQETDELVSSLLAGCRGHLSLAELLAILAAANELSADEVVAAALPVVTDLIQHGMVLPVELA
ncbi:MAG TPA: methyltransferase [Actinokineospora sp.]|nr:methyltransferase [Actinokineospora sp.]